MLRLLTIFTWLGCVACLLGACSGPAASPPTCNLSYDCGAGQTCWTKNGVDFSCVSAGTGQIGDACDPSLGAGPSCGAGLVCLGQGAAGGTCTGWCGTNRACPSDQVCLLLTSSNDVDARVCSISKSSSCAFDYACGANETCWTNDGFNFSCMAAGTLALGVACDASDTKVQCAAGLVCFGGAAGSACTAWCNGDGTCPSGQTCRTLGTTQGITVRVCQ